MESVVVCSPNIFILIKCLNPEFYIPKHTSHFQFIKSRNILFTNLKLTRSNILEGRRKFVSYFYDFSYSFDCFLQNFFFELFVYNHIGFTFNLLLEIELEIIIICKRKYVIEWTFIHKNVNSYTMISPTIKTILLNDIICNEHP
jgi:hypothetical protein